jgi:PTH1 family peptidyl-tRNA hydrolase
MGIFSFFSRLLSDNRCQSVDFLIIGLGNIGEQYSATRHNIGFRVADKLIDSIDLKKEGKIPEAAFFCGTIDSKSVVVAKPSTLMNRSGTAVKKLISHFNVDISSVLVVVDDFNLPLGKIRLRKNGTHGGHNGLKSIISYVGTDFPRLRVGIGPLPLNADVIEFVLGDFSAQEEAEVQRAVEKAAEASIQFTKINIDVVMSRFNN